MLEKCLQGETQNTNESFNGMIWNRVSKVTHVGFDVLSVGVYDAIFHFNNGEKAVLDVLELHNVDPGSYMTESCRSFNMCFKRLFMLRHSKKKQQDKNIETEGTSYEMGSF